MTFRQSKKGVLNRLLSTFPVLAARWGQTRPAPPVDVPWAEPLLPLRQATVAVISTCGLHLRAQPPFDLSHAGGDPSLRRIPIAASREELSITVGYYDHAAAEADLNVVLPVQRLLELKGAGALGALHPTAYSLMGHLGESRLAELKEQTAVRITEDLVSAGVHYALLVPT